MTIRFRSDPSNHLYRGLTPKEIETGRIVPRGKSNRYQIIINMDPFVLNTVNFSSSQAEAIRHQLHNETAGISTTKSFDVAMRFATRNGLKDGFVARISREKFSSYGIAEFDAELFGLYEKRMDQEVILFARNGGFYFPKEIVVEFIQVRASDWATQHLVIGASGFIRSALTIDI